MNKIYLQLFAEEGDPENGGSEQNQAEQGKQGTEQGGTQGNDDKAGGAPAKYTDDDLNRIIAAKKAEWIKKKDAEVDEAKKLADMNAQTDEGLICVALVNAGALFKLPLISQLR